jgi:hypothetical protein
MGKCLLHEQEGEERELAFASTSFLFFFASTTVNLFAAFLPLFIFHIPRALTSKSSERRRERARERRTDKREFCFPELIFLAPFLLSSLFLFSSLIPP